MDLSSTIDDKKTNELQPIELWYAEKPQIIIIQNLKLSINLTNK